MEVANASLAMANASLVVAEKPIISGAEFIASRKHHHNIGVVIGMLGVIFNGISLYVFARKQKLVGELSRIIIMNQCTVDMIGGAFLILAQFHSFYIGPYMPDLSVPNPELYCKILWSTFSLWAFMHTSASNIQLLCVERYLSVCHPFKHRDYLTPRRMYVIVVIQWFVNIGFICQLLPYFHYIADGNMCLFKPPHESFLTKFYAFSFPFFYYLVPGFISGFCYTRMFMVLKNRVAVAGGQSDEEKRKTRSFVITCCFVSIAYIVCFTGSMFIWILSNLKVAKLDPTAFYHIFSILMVFSNCFINPVIFVTKMPAFRQELRMMFGCGKHGQQKDEGMSMSVTNTTQAA